MLLFWAGCVCPMGVLHVALRMGTIPKHTQTANMAPYLPDCTGSSRLIVGGWWSGEWTEHAGVSSHHESNVSCVHVVRASCMPLYCMCSTWSVSNPVEGGRAQYTDALHAEGNDRHAPIHLHC